MQGRRDSPKIHWVNEREDVTKGKWEEKEWQKKQGQDKLRDTRGGLGGQLPTE